MTVWTLLVSIAGLTVTAPMASAQAEPPPEISPWSGTVVLEEVVTDPQTDRDGAGTVTSIDEYVEIRNAGDETRSLRGWTLRMEDSTPEEMTLDGELAAGAIQMVLNPPGAMNNDVRLLLSDDLGRIVDDVTLGSNASLVRHEDAGWTAPAHGNADEALDEAVALTAPWLGERTPASPGTPLAPLWFERLAALHQDEAGTSPDAIQELALRSSFQGDWYRTLDFGVAVRAHAPDRAPEPSPFRMRLHDASGGRLVSDVPLQPSPQDPEVHVTASVDLPNGTSAALVVTFVSSDGQVIGTWPDGTEIMFRPDLVPPRVEAAAAVVDPAGNITWLPRVWDAESGLRAARVGVPANATNGTVGWLSCHLSPEADAPPGASCVLDDPLNVTHLVIEAQDVAGHHATMNVTWVRDDAPPEVPALSFVAAATPTLRWAPFTEPITRLVVEIAEDAGGAWPVANVTIAPDATSFVDDTYAPGDPRAFRLVATDRGGHTVAGPWYAMPADAVPVQVLRMAADDGGDMATAALTLARAGEVRLEFTLDRPLEQSPDAVLHVTSPRPLWVSGEVSMTPDRDAFVARFVRPSGFPLDGEGEWRLVGGAAEDGAPIAETAAPVAWDLGPPRVDVQGAPDGWVRGKRHVITVTATDALDAHPQIRLDERPKGVTMSGKSDHKRITVRGEGLFALSGTATDDDGNVARFTIAAGVDGTAPTLHLLTLPDVWTLENPIVLGIEDGLSGPATAVDDVFVWIRLADGTAFAANTSWLAWEDGATPDGSRLLVRPPTELEGTTPRAVHVAAYDRAGNLAEGTLGHAFDPAVPGEPATAQARDGEFGMGATPPGAATGDASERPQPRGPEWRVRAPSELEQTSHASGRGGSETSGPDWQVQGQDASRGRVDHREDDTGAAGAWSLAGFGVLAGLGSVIHRRRRRKAGGSG